MHVFIVMHIEKLFMPFLVLPMVVVESCYLFCVSFMYSILPSFLLILPLSLMCCLISAYTAVSLEYMYFVPREFSGTLLIVQQHTSESFVVNVREWSLKVCEIC